MQLAHFVLVGGLRPPTSNRRVGAEPPCGTDPA